MGVMKGHTTSLGNGSHGNFGISMHAVVPLLLLRMACLYGYPC